MARVLLKEAFFINKMVDDNMKEKYLISQKIVYNIL